MDECYGECDTCSQDFDPSEEGAECDCGGIIELIECVDGCDWCT